MPPTEPGQEAEVPVRPSEVADLVVLSMVFGFLVAASDAACAGGFDWLDREIALVADRVNDRIKSLDLSSALPVGSEAP